MSDMLSQEEINALLGEGGSESDNKSFLTDEKKDILGEIGNISMGTAATTLFALLNHKVEISVPTVSLIDTKELASKYDRPCVGLKIAYKEGLIGTNLLILKQYDVKIIAALMMGGDASTVSENDELTDLDLSAICEAMNQMIGSSSTSLSSMLGYKIDISTPEASILTFQEGDTFFETLDLGGDEFICNSFRMVVGDLIDSEIMQILPIEFAEEIINKLGNISSGGEAPKEAPKIEKEQSEPMQTQTNAPQMDYNANTGGNIKQSQNVQDVQAAQFQSFDIAALNQQKENITIIRDVPLEVTVELGRTRKIIKEILEFNPGTVIELDKIAGEPIDILVNGKFVAKGEVVVIDENFGVRITNIISVDERI